MCSLHWVRTFLRSHHRHSDDASFCSPGSLEELVGKSVHISLSHLDYDGRLAASYELYGRITRIDEAAIIVHLFVSGKECRLRRDVRIFEKSKEADLGVSVGSVGVAYLNDLTRCLYPPAAGL